MTFTGTTAISPVGLPSDVASDLRSNTRYCTRSALPALGKLYQDAKATVQERLALNLYPEFVKYQLSRCLTAALSKCRLQTGQLKSEYPGLGDSFCISDPLQPDNPVVYTSDGLLDVSGFKRSEFMDKNARFMQGVATDSRATRRLGKAISAGQAATELLINYRPDGTPFWNLLFICPLMEEGTVRFFLGAQVNVSDSIGPDHKDILRVLNFGPPPQSLHPLAASSVARESASVEQEQSTGQGAEAKASRRRRLFGRFQRKRTESREASPPSRRHSTSSQPATPDTPPPTARPYTPLSSPRSPQPEASLDEHATPYSRFFVMHYAPPPAKRRFRLDRRPSRDASPSMTVAFCSSFALTLLGHRPHDAHAVVGRDIFSVLSDDLGSPRMNRCFKAPVMGKMAAGEAVTADLMAASSPPAGRPPLRHVQTAGTLRTRLSRPPDPAGTGTGPSPGRASGESGSRPRLSETLDRGTEFFSQVVWGPGKLRRLVSNWVPLKDGEGKVVFVVLTLTPVDD